MYLTKEKKEEIFAEYGKNAQDTGSIEAPITTPFTPTRLHPAMVSSISSTSEGE